MITEAERCYIAGFEDKGRVPEDKEFTQSLEAATDKYRDSLLEPTEEPSTGTT